MKTFCNHRHKLSTPLVFTIFILCCMIVIFFFESIGLTQRDKVKMFKEINQIHEMKKQENKLLQENEQILNFHYSIQDMIYTGMQSQIQYQNSKDYIKEEENEICKRLGNCTDELEEYFIF